MPEPFKNRFSVSLINEMSVHIANQFESFHKERFIHEATFNLNDLELKARSLQITSALLKHLPQVTVGSVNDIYEKLINSLTPTSLIDEEKAISGGQISEHGIEGWAIMPLADFIAFSYLVLNEHSEVGSSQQQKTFVIAMQTLKEMTKRFTTEFAIRHLIKAAPEQAISLLNSWLDDKNYHVRRLISEGSRPRLPWGIQLSEFVADPTPLLPLLEALKDDDELYVRRSVANNMNDIAKDHPELVAKLTSSWLNPKNKQRLQLVKHACRTLIKNGNPTILSALGFSEIQLESAKLTVDNPRLLFGNSIQLVLTLNSTLNHDQAMNIDYRIHHQKANGTTSPKVFKWKTTTLKANTSINIIKKHTVKHVTTRTYYPGIHKIEVLINGHVVCSNAFELVFNESH